MRRLTIGGRGWRQTRLESQRFGFDPNVDRWLRAGTRWSGFVFSKREQSAFVDVNCSL